MFSIYFFNDAFNGCIRFSMNNTHFAIYTLKTFEVTHTWGLF